jgi:hypothetical protein
MVSNLLKRWRDVSATVKRQRDGFGAFQKKRDAIPSHLKHWCYREKIYYISTRVRTEYLVFKMSVTVCVLSVLRIGQDNSMNGWLQGG